MSIYFEDPDVVLFQGDVQEGLTWLGEDRVDAIVTSPPYQDMRPEYASPDVQSFHGIFRELRRVCSGTLLLNVGRFWRDRVEQMWWLRLLDIAERTGWAHRDTLLWLKPNANPIQGEIVTNSHEYVFCFGDGFTPDEVRTPYAPGSVERLERRWVSSISVKGDGPERSGARRAERRGERRDANPDGARAKSYFEFPTGKEKGNKHPAPMPLEVAEHLVKLSGGKRILDPFAGSGTTLLAARRLGLEAVGIELSPEYCQMTAERLGQQLLFRGGTSE